MAEYDYAKLKQCGSEVFISANVEIRRPQLVSIGKCVAIDSGFYCTTQADIGDYVHIGPYVSVIGGASGLLRLGHFVTIGAGSRLICASDEFNGEGLSGFQAKIPERFRDPQRIAPIVVHDFVNIGSNVVVLPGIVLGEGSVIGSGAVVTKSTQPWSISFGCPARKVKERPSTLIREYAARMGYGHVIAEALK